MHEPAAGFVKKVQLITDGACLGNPGPGGWACILRYKSQSARLYGYAPHTTNNRMELTAAIEGLRALKEPCEVEVVTDSEYVKNGITEWIHGWKRNGWTTARKKPVVNQDLWEELDDQKSAGTRRTGPGPRATPTTTTTIAPTNWPPWPRESSGPAGSEARPVCVQPLLSDKRILHPYAVVDLHVAHVLAQDNGSTGSFGCNNN